MPDILDDLQIRDLAHELKIPYEGCWSRDDKGLRLASGKLTVINLDSIEGPGTHWCSIIDFPTHLEYCDSYGGYPPEEVEKLAGDKTILYQNEQLQKGSARCGWYCLMHGWARLVLKQPITIVHSDYINEKTVERFQATINS